MFRSWYQDFTAESIRAELESGGFRVLGSTVTSWAVRIKKIPDWIGIVAERLE